MHKFCYVVSKLNKKLNKFDEERYNNIFNLFFEDNSKTAHNTNSEKKLLRSKVGYVTVNYRLFLQS